MSEHTIRADGGAVDPARRQRQLGKAYRALINLARQKRSAAQAASADLAESGD